ncbi:heavy metal translocating P-type ATPase [Poseidonocella sp. HB161398]|uniref:heavy metal translocating P-type ATPase n=1 Tax=Poseidonocella sp. HB161398 TaxID=2320855 RepID=UPI001107FE8E|nr:heavy metal translocating P-type ATPase [Poseidonocella sp. HB161398]
MAMADSAEIPGAAACPACVATDPQETVARIRAASTERLMLSLPGIADADAMMAAERALRGVEGVREARVNMTMKRAAVTAAGTVTPEMLVAALTAAGVEAHELDAGTLAATQTDRTGRELLMRLGVAGFATMNVMLLSVSVWAGAEGATRDLFHWISAMIALPTVAFAGQPFYRNAWSALRRGSLNMDVPITLAIVLTIVTSLYETVQSGAHAYFDATLMLCFFLLAGRYLDHRTRAVARSAAEELAALEVARATRIRDGAEETVPQAELAVGDLIRVRPGARIPVDGVVAEGSSELDRALLTGETLPVFAGPGVAVSAGEVNLTGPLVMRATAVGRDTSLHALTDLVAIAESGRSQYSSLADKAAKLYAPGVHILSALAFAGWLAGTGDLRVALNIAAAVLIITCPCALGLAVPAVTTAASGRLFRRGLLIKDATALERLAETDIAVFDKTGTLTLGQPEAEGFAALDPAMQPLAAGIAQGSAHPLAMAITRAADAEGVAPAPVEALREVPGYGIEGRWQGQVLRLGRLGWTGGDGAEAQGTATWLRLGEDQPLAIGFCDRLRPGAREAVEGLKAQGLEVQLLSGDAEPAVRALAESLGIATWRAGMLPAEKAAHVQALAGAGAKVLMAGDGLNDTAALASAHASVSPASALEAARVASDMVLLHADLSAIPEARATARKAVRRIRENFRIATVYNVLAVPLAVAGLCSPLIAAAAMSASSITVSLNALRVR